MSADDILYEPIVKTDWRAQCRQIVHYIENHKNAPSMNKTTGRAVKTSPVHPDGALLLEQLCRLYHEYKQDIFWLIYVPSMGFQPVERREIYFNGKLAFGRYEDGDCPRLATVMGFSIRDLNLVRNRHTHHYVFATRQEADAYWSSIDP